MNHKLKEAICAKIKALRKKRGYSQNEVAALLNMQQNSYSRIETGKTHLDIERLSQISKLYKISINELVSVPSDR